MSTWTFLTNHAHVMLCLARDPEIRLRDVAVLVGITERAAQRIVSELEAEQYVTAEKVGRRNRYAVHPEAPLRHPLEENAAVGALLHLLDDRLVPAGLKRSRPDHRVPARDRTARLRASKD